MIDTFFDKFYSICNKLGFHASEKTEKIKTYFRT